MATGQSVQGLPETAQLEGVACPSTASCFAVGYYTGIVTALLNPATGQLASGQSVLAYGGDGELSGVACASATECLAVGIDGAGDTMTWALVPAGIFLSPSSLPNATIGTAYPSTTFTASGGTSPYTFAVTSGNLPDGVTLINGVLGGTPTSSAQTETFTVTATDSAIPALTGSQTYTITVNDPVTVSDVSPDSGPAGGGSVVTITGTDFSPASTVEFGTVAATLVSSISATELEATSPPEALGPVDVIVTTGGVPSEPDPADDQFSYLPPPPPPAPPSGASSSASGTCAGSSSTCNATDNGTTVTGNGFGSFTVAQYSSDPVGAPSFSSAGEYIDVQVAPGSSFSGLTVQDCDLNGGTSLLWWNGSAWETVSSGSYSTGPPECVTATLSPTSTPTMSDLTGTVFGVALPTPSATTVIASSNPSTYGESVTFTAAVSPTDGGGTVAFYVAGSATPISGCGTAVLSLVSGNYQATCETSVLAAGTYSISATYSGDSVYATSTGTLSPDQTVQSAATSFAVTVNGSSTSASVPYGTVASLAETGVLPAATGTVTFTSGSTALCTITLPSTSCTTSPTLAVGSYSNFAGAFIDTDGNYSDALSTNTVSLAVTSVATGAPIAVADHFDTAVDTTLTVNPASGVLANDTLNGATIVSKTNPAHGTLTLNANGSFTYTPARHFDGVDSFTYTLRNSSGSSSATVTIDVPARADLSVTLSAPLTANPASPFSYTMTVRNAGPDPAIGVIASLSLPAGLTIISVSSGHPLQLFGLLIWSTGTLAPNASLSYTVVVEVNRKAPSTLTVLAAAAATGSIDPNLSDNVATAATKT